MRSHKDDLREDYYYVQKSSHSYIASWANNRPADICSFRICNFDVRFCGERSIELISSSSYTEEEPVWYNYSATQQYWVACFLMNCEFI